MKLAEALQERADLNKNIEQLIVRLSNCALVQDGEEPIENFTKLKQDLDSCLERLSYLMLKINLTNCKVVVDNMTLTEMIAKKDTLLAKVKGYRRIISAGSQNTYRATGSEIKIKTTFSITSMQEEINLISKEIRLIDNKIQETNWTTDLIE